ncbi:hypothetical protein [Flavobacterium sp. PLA-1-15]|uniref:hypothetical protein n=1 Tax=Flavobacterium sp. PLA-1-15 TaxID=3380533 RepID=UPI003B987AC7
MTQLQIRILEDLKTKFNIKELDTKTNDKILLLDSLILYLYQQFFSPKTDELDLFEIIDNVQYYILQNMNEAFTGEKAIDTLFDYANKLAGTDSLASLEPIALKNYLSLITEGMKFYHGFGFGDEISEEEGLDWQMDIVNFSNKKLKLQGYEISWDLVIKKAD